MRRPPLRRARGRRRDGRHEHACRRRRDAHAGLFGGAQVELGVAGRIDDGRGCLAAATEQVRDANWIGVKELAKDHGLALLATRG
jgi:hypothetical protein